MVLDVARSGGLDLMAPRVAREELYRDENAARLHRWRIDLQGGRVRSEPRDDVPAEFPRVDERRLGRKHRYGYMAALGPDALDGGMPVFTALRKYDLVGGGIEERQLGAGTGASEPLFVPRAANADEDDGYVVTLVYDQARNASEFLILAASDIAGDPVARVRLPNRVPYGFHGNWVPAA